MSTETGGEYRAVMGASEGERVDVVVVGSGPAGLQAALTLARGQRRVVVVAGTTRRNQRAHGIFNLVSRDGVAPETFREIAWKELESYGVARVEGAVEKVEGRPGDFRLCLAEAGESRLNGPKALHARRVLLAGGVVDVLPDWPGLAELWGETVFQCPLCHGHPLRGRRWGLVMAAPEGLPHISLFLAWTTDLSIFTPGWEADEETRAAFAKRGVRFVAGQIEGLVARADGPDRIAGVRVEGNVVPCDALVMHPPQDLLGFVKDLDLRLDAQGCVEVDMLGRSSQAGISAAGDMTTRFQSAVAAMASGQRAAAGLCMDLAAEDWSTR